MLASNLVAGGWRVERTHDWGVKKSSSCIYLHVQKLEIKTNSAVRHRLEAPKLPFCWDDCRFSIHPVLRSILRRIFTRLKTSSATNVRIFLLHGAVERSSILPTQRKGSCFCAWLLYVMSSLQFVTSNSSSEIISITIRDVLTYKPDQIIGKRMYELTKKVGFAWGQRRLMVDYLASNIIHAHIKTPTFSWRSNKTFWYIVLKTGTKKAVHVRLP